MFALFERSSRTFSFVVLLAVFCLLQLTGCGGSTHPDSSTATSAANSNTPIIIASGGTYTGHWVSSDPTIPAVIITTDEPVVIENSSVTSKGDLIRVQGSGGSEVVVRNVTGVALDPGVAGQSRGVFLSVDHASSLNVSHCTMTGVSFGVSVANSTLKSLSISNNMAKDMEDRASDGQGGLITQRPSLGHFVLLNTVSIPNGGDIAWNQVINTPGNASVEDIINIYLSQGGSTANSIRVHDNYLQGAFSTGTDNYTGGGIVTDGGSNDSATATAFVQIQQNQIVQTAGYGVAIAAGHDVSLLNNSVVSCGKTSDGVWLATRSAVGAYMWNYYDSSQFFNDSISETTGGLVRPDPSGNPMPSDIWVPSASSQLQNTVADNPFSNPCLASGQLIVTPETTAYNVWISKLSAGAQTIGAPTN